jgi:FtsH-binding integral membrane protein
VSYQLDPRGSGQLGGVTVQPGAAVATGASYLGQAFLWMFAGLLLTAGIAFALASNESLLIQALGYVLPIIIGQFVIVLAISFLISRINATVALLLFFVYAASMGLTLAVIVSQYSTSAVATASISSAAMFGAAGLYGYTTKRSLAGIGSMLFMGLIGLIVASVVNMFLGSDTISWVISIVGVVLFVGLTAYHVQAIASGALAQKLGSNEKAAVFGALSLYLDFINLFLFLLRIFGGGRR